MILLRRRPWIERAVRWPSMLLRTYKVLRKRNARWDSLQAAWYTTGLLLRRVEP